MRTLFAATILAAFAAGARPAPRSEAPAASAGWVNPLDLMPAAAPPSGSWADGTSRLLSTQFTNLAKAQAVYPRARSLSEEIDGHALQRALDDCPVGGTVYLPPGRTFRVNFTILMWKGVRVLGGGTMAAGASYWDRYGQIQVVGDLAGIQFDRNAAPPGHRNPGFEEYGPSFRNVRFRGTSTGDGHNQTALLLGQAFSGGSVEACQFMNFDVGIGMSGTWINRIADNLFVSVAVGVRVDASWDQVGPSHGWFEVNALRIEHNNFQGMPKVTNGHGVLIFSVGNSISISENVFEHFEGQGSSAISLASYPDAEPRSGGEDLGQPVMGVEVRGNYEETNRAFLELGRQVGAGKQGGGAPDARRTALTAPVDVLVTQNQYNCDGSANGSKIRIHACWRCTIRDNSARHGTWPFPTLAQEIELVNAFPSSAMGAGWESNDNLGLRGFHDDLDIVAERGWVGYPQNARPFSVRLALRERASTRVEQDGARDWNAVSVGATPAPAWQPRHRYAKGDFVKTGANLYRCVVAGNSGATAPAGTLGGIPDGTVRWAWYAPQVIDDRWKMLSLHAGTPNAPIDQATFATHKRHYVMAWRPMLDPATPVTP